MGEEFDPRGHVLVPEHRVLSREEGEEVLRRYR
ncbi:MAG: DNA-directed RNA polymerase subunit H, partial [Hadesarchaea archaeon]